jgi:hypothetical protein
MRLNKIAVFFHCLFFVDGQFSINAFNIVSEQMEMLRLSGLLDECDELIVGINGGQESLEMARLVIPSKAKLVMHGLESKSENLTIVELERWAPLHLGWDILYFHAKGCTRGGDQNHLDKVSHPWRRAMMSDLVWNWRYCVSELESGYDIVCSHWMWNMADGTQHIPAGNFLWITARFAANLPSLFLRSQVKTHGIAAAESRWEAEVKWGNGKIPNVREIRPHGGDGVPWVKQDGKRRLVMMNDP